MSEQFVAYELEIDCLPPLEEWQKAEIEALKAQADDPVNYEEIPPLDDDFWKNAVRKPFYPPCPA